MNVLRYFRVLLFDMVNECCPNDGMDANVAMDAYIRWLRLAMRDDCFLGGCADTRTHASLPSIWPHPSTCQRRVPPPPAAACG